MSILNFTYQEIIEHVCLEHGCSNIEMKLVRGPAKHKKYLSYARHDSTKKYYILFARSLELFCGFSFIFFVLFTFLSLVYSRESSSNIFIL